jgi:hypothetical protein
MLPGCLGLVNCWWPGVWQLMAAQLGRAVLCYRLFQQLLCAVQCNRVAPSTQAGTIHTGWQSND